ncbi:MAG: glycogen/starch/alpha-glucan phosphorylase [Candidatus Omnitrophica bacterium]|nr:glycogen/starch/alpha-glucan phosphorylase [Candidatus Omnitrophota bacterium]
MAESSKWVDFHKDISLEGIKRSFWNNRLYPLAKDEYAATEHDNFLALAITVRDRIVERWAKTQQRYHKNNLKRVYYLSMEFLIGRLLGNYIYNLGLEKVVPEALSEMGMKLEDLREQEVDTGLGNGGLGRLAACFLDSMATLGIPAHGYGIRYDYGIFQQKIVNGYQVELPDEWLRLGCPWEFARPEYTVKIHFYGRVDEVREKDGTRKKIWIDTQDVLAVPYDIPIPGYKNDVINTLRLWSARSTEEFDLEYFNSGDYEQAVYRKIFSENISKVLYPNDSQVQGKELRLKQEYFFTAASISDIFRRFKVENADFKKLPNQAVIQLNDTHPALAITELMRVLIDDEGLDWEQAWGITRKTFAYTNHTLMPEALECWTVDLLERVLPRHLQIIYEINDWFIKEIRRKFPNDDNRVARMSLIGEGYTKHARMAYLSVVGSFSVNGVSALHSELLKSRVFKDFYEFYPEKFNNKTNGITQRRWLLKSNPELSTLITKTIGDEWTTNLAHINKILPLKDNASFRNQWAAIKLNNKKALSEYILKNHNIKVDPTALFDVQVKRMHEYKRQMLFTLYVIAQYVRIIENPKSFSQPRVCIIGGKAAPGYALAKLIIKFINNVSEVINNDKKTKNKLQLFFLENYRVSLAEKIFPASDLSEQISTAGTEASGTGNMKFMLNGALTIGTLDGANVEMAQLLNKDEIFIFGLKDQEVQELRTKGYNPQPYISQSQVLKKVYDLITSGTFNKNAPGLFDQLIDNIFVKDPYLVCADFDSYCQTQEAVSQEFQNKDAWVMKSIANVARTGHFSSDRTIRQYAQEIWNIPCCK